MDKEKKETSEIGKLREEMDTVLMPDSRYLDVASPSKILEKYIVKLHNCLVELEIENEELKNAQSQ